MQQPWQFWIDVGGTFTDCMAERPDGSLLRHKLLSSAITKGTVAAVPTRIASVDPRDAGMTRTVLAWLRLTLVSRGADSRSFQPLSYRV